MMAILWLYSIIMVSYLLFGFILAGCRGKIDFKTVIMGIAVLLPILLFICLK